MTTKAKTFQTLGALMETAEWAKLTDAEQRLVALMVRRFGDEMFPSQEKLSKLQRVCRKTINRRLAHIVEVGVFTVDAAVYGRRGSDGRSSNTYRVNPSLVGGMSHNLSLNLSHEVLGSQVQVEPLRGKEQKEEKQEQEKLVKVGSGLGTNTLTLNQPSLSDALAPNALEVQNIAAAADFRADLDAFIASKACDLSYLDEPEPVYAGDERD
jgi:hypothetical protein